MVQGGASVSFTYRWCGRTGEILFAVHGLGKTVRTTVDYLQAARVAAFPGQGVKGVFITARGDGSRSGHNAYGYVFFRADVIQRGVDPGVDDADSFHTGLAFVQVIVDVFQPVCRGGIAGHYNGLDFLPCQKQDVFDDQLPKEIRLIFCGVLAVRHVGLIAQVDVIFTGKQFAGQDGFQHGQTARAGIEYAYGQVVSDRWIRIKICVKSRGGVVEGSLNNGQLLRLPVATGKHKEACQ